MGKRITNFSCECGFDNQLVYKKPDFFTPTVGTFNCVGCDTRYQYQINKYKKDLEKIELHTKILKESEMLRLLRDGEAFPDLPETP